MSLQSGRALIKTIVIRAFLKTYEIMFIGNRNKIMEVARMGHHLKGHHGKTNANGGF